MESSFNLFLLLPYGFLASWFVFSVIYYSKAKSDYTLVNTYWLDSIPSIFTTLGVFGTFLGIAIALNAFNPTDIDASLPPLLDGMRTAFWTSIIGIGCSLVFQKMIQSVQYHYDKMDDTNSDPLTKVSNALRELKESIAGEEEGSLSNHMIKLRLLMKDELKPLKAIQDGVGGTGETSLLTQIQRLREDQSDELKEIQKNHGVIDQHFQTLINSNDEQSELLKKSDEQSDTRNEYLKELNQMMGDTHSIMRANSELIDRKFTEFTELLEKANTDALTKAIESVIGDFNNKLNELIDRLVKENFEELNKSVQSLNEWQQQNKIQVETLINQFTQVSKELSISSETLEKTANSSEKLVSEDSKLTKLIKELYEVVQEDQKFIDAIVQLQKTTSDLGEASDGLKVSLIETSNFMKESMVNASKEMKNDMTEASKEMKDNMSNAGSSLKEFISESSQLWEKSLKEQKSYNDELKDFIDVFKTRNNEVLSGLNEIAKNLSTDSELLKEIAKQTGIITDSESKLVKLLKEFEELSDENNRFITASEKLGLHAETLDIISNKMDQWAQNQANVEISLNNLVDRLAEIEELRNNTDGFFNDVKDQFSEAAGILTTTNESIRNQNDEFRKTMVASLQGSFETLDSIMAQSLEGLVQRLREILNDRNLRN